MTGILTGSLVIDLGAESYAADRRAVYAAGLDRAPAGTRVVVLVGRRPPSLDRWVVETLQTETQRLRVDVRASDGDTLAAWHRMLRGEDS